MRKMKEEINEIEKKTIEKNPWNKDDSLKDPNSNKVLVRLAKRKTQKLPGSGTK